MRRFTALAFCAPMILTALCLSPLSTAAKDHSSQVTANGTRYQWLKGPVVVILINWGDSAYVSAAFPLM